MAILACPSSLRLPLLRTSKRQERGEVAEHFRDFVNKAVLGFGSRPEFLSDYPGPELFPGDLLHRPTLVIRPFAFFRRVPIAFVFLSEAAALPRNPFTIFSAARTPDLNQRGCLFTAVDAESACDGLCRNPDVKLAAFAPGLREIEIHLSPIRRLVAREANVAVDAGKIVARAPADDERGIQFLRRRRHAIEQRAKWLDDSAAIAIAVFVHPRFAVVSPQLAEESHRVVGKNRRLAHRDCVIFGVQTERSDRHNGSPGGIQEDLDEKV